jgi:elongation factor Ts
MAISAKDVMDLRTKTGMGMMECKEALTEAGGDAAKAIDILRTKAKGKMDLRADRAASQGTLAVARSADAKSIALIELNTETDFVAKNEGFVAAAEQVAKLALAANDGDVTADAKITAIIDQLRITTKENASFARGVKVSGGKVGSYVHHNRQLGAVIVVEGDAPDDLLTGLCQHVVAHVPTPVAVDEAGLPADEVAKNKAAFIEEAKASGKPAEIAEKMAGGKLRKWVDENTLLGQFYVKDPTGKTQVRAALPKGVTVKKFIRYQVGVK